MLKIRKNRGHDIACSKCKKDIEYRDDYYWDTETGEILCVKCGENGGD